MNVEGALGDEIRIYRNDDTEPIIRPALEAQQRRNPTPVCITDTKKGDTFRFEPTGTDNVSLRTLNGPTFASYVNYMVFELNVYDLCTKSIGS